MATSSMSHVPNGDGKGAAAVVDTGIGAVKEGQNVAGAHGLGEDPVPTGDPARIEHCKFIISNQIRFILYVHVHPLLTLQCPRLAFDQHPGESGALRGALVADAAKERRDDDERKLRLRLRL